jgi:hypothetical protein
VEKNREFFIEGERKKKKKRTVNNNHNLKKNNNNRHHHKIYMYIKLVERKNVEETFLIGILVVVNV